MKLIKKRADKRLLTFALSLIVLINFFALTLVKTHAHEEMLEIGYDICDSVNQGDGIGEIWYVLDGEDENGNMMCYHLSHTEDTIKYYFEPDDYGYTWEDASDEDVVDEIQTAIADSMEKWNNVYFYSQDASGNLIKNRLIIVEEGSADCHNLSIFPDFGNEYAATVAYFYENEAGHLHNSDWEMYVNAYHFYYDPRSALSHTAAEVEYLREAVGAHEIGHILGLRDVEVYCNAVNGSYGHHEEVLMGYGDPIEEMCTDITYKDIAGVAITRGFHTDSDHKWLNCGRQSDHNNNYKLLCSICNGVKYVSSLSGYTYNTYNACNGDHHLGQENMMAVASYGDMDYYKCKYCKYVAPFSMIEPQDYSNASYYNNTYHRYTNYVEGLGYKYLEEHNLDSDGYCTECNAHIDHEYGSYSYSTKSTHARTCSCGATQTETHYIDRHSIVDGRYAMCLGCGVLLDLNNDFAQLLSLPGVKYSINGSYLLPSGIAVLEDEDMEAYLNGTLRFYNQNDLPVTQ